jgi:hypothetical protein
VVVDMLLLDGCSVYFSKILIYSFPQKWKILNIYKEKIKYALEKLNHQSNYIYNKNKLKKGKQK